MHQSFVTKGDMGHIMRKTDLGLCENKGADQLHSNCQADQHLCFHYMDSAISLPLKSEACFCDCTGGFVLHLVGNPIDHFSRIAAHIKAKNGRAYKLSIPLLAGLLAGVC